MLDASRPGAIRGKTGLSIAQSTESIHNLAYFVEVDNILINELTDLCIDGKRLG